MMGLVRASVALSATPVFWALALIAFFASRNPAMVICGQNLPPFAAALASMWLMYALMGLFHSGPWLGLLQRGIFAPAPCCEPAE